MGRSDRLDDTLRHQRHREHDRQRQEHMHDAANEIDPEIADCPGGRAGEPADQRYQDGHPHRRRHEVLHRESQHLRAVAHRRLAAVALPVRVRHETDGGVERRIDRYRRQTRGIERQEVLESLDEKGREKARDAEGDRGCGVAVPGHFVGGVGACDPVDAPLERPEQPREERRAAGVDIRHEPTQRDAEHDQECAQQRQLEQALWWRQGQG